jgi:GNAT superfamily N-acetyltransferase
LSPEATESERVTLEPGLEVIIRPIRPEDRHLMTAAFTRLSPESRYQRFFAPVERLSESDLTYLTEIDHHLHEALVAIDPEDGGLVGVARYVCEKPEEGPEGGTPALGTLKPAGLTATTLREAEVAVIVGDPWQGKGLASALLQRLARRASEEGIDYFLALVLEDNEGANELFRNLVDDASEVSGGEPGTVEIRIELPGTDSFKDSVLARALGNSARGSLKVSPWRRLQHRLAQNRGRRKAQPD